MSHFIIQSLKVVKLTDGDRELYTLGFAGKDNNISYYGSPRTTVEFFHTVNTDKVLAAISALSQDVLSGGMQLKDKYNEPLSLQAEFFAKRLATSFKNAKTVKVDKLGDDAIEWGSGEMEIKMLFPKVIVSVSKNMKYDHSLSFTDVDHAAIVKVLLDKEKNKELVIPALKEAKYLTAYLPIQKDILDRFGRVSQKALPENKFNLNEVIEVAKYAGDWNNPVPNTDIKIKDIETVKSIIENDQDPARRFTIIHGLIDSDLLFNKDFALNCAKNKVFLKFFPDSIKSDKEIAQVFVSNQPRNIEYVSNALKSDYDFIMNTISNATEGASYILKEASFELQDNETIARKSLEQSSYAFQYFSERLRDIPEICLLAAEKNKYSHQYFSPRLKELCDSNNPVPGLLKLVIENNLDNTQPNQSKRAKI